MGAEYSFWSLSRAIFGQPPFKHSQLNVSVTSVKSLWLEDVSEIDCHIEAIIVTELKILIKVVWNVVLVDSCVSFLNQNACFLRTIDQKDYKQKESETSSYARFHRGLTLI